MSAPMPVFCEACGDEGICLSCDRGSVPVRVQLLRQKGWRMPANTVKVDRTTRFGNPYRVGQVFNDVKGGVRDNAHAVELYRAMYSLDSGRRPVWPDGWRVLIGKNLACWCKLGEPCHADVLLELVAKWAAEVSP